jgi:hypothetical protein
MAFARRWTQQAIVEIGNASSGFSRCGDGVAR